MAVLKCKMCGGELSYEPDATVCECEYCGSKQTIPKVDDEKKIKLYERANRLRMANEFDKASTVYEGIIEEDDTEAEAYWGLILCKYGIEYVDDPATGDKIPTCHRSSFDSIMDDEDFEMVMENSDALSRNVYREQAKQIEEIRKGIIEVSGKEEPYDIFICYKETDENGDRTIDSVLAQDVYDALTDKGYRVFFSRISLEDKLGTEYEPYIFAALNSAKIMLAFGTSYDYYNAVWVKNEWSRYLKLMAKDKAKYLIPCFKDIDAYDMPKEFAKLQSQDMGKVGAVQDLLRGIDKILKPEGNKTENSVHAGADAISKAVATAISSHGNNNDALLKRGYMALEDEEWEKAEGFFEDVLNQDAECTEAYFGKLMSECKCKTKESLKNCKDPFDKSNNYQKVLRFGNQSLQDELKGYIQFIKDRNENQRLNGIYNKAIQQMKSASNEKNYSDAARIFGTIIEFKDSRTKFQECIQKAKEAKNKVEEQRKAEIESKYQRALAYMGLAPNPENKEQFELEKQRHQEAIEKLNASLSMAEENAEKEREKVSKEINAEIATENKAYTNEKSELESQMNSFEKQTNERISANNNELASLGIFSMKRKKEIQEENNSLSNKLIEKKNEVDTRKQELEAKHQTKLQKINSKKEEIYAEVNQIKNELSNENSKHSLECQKLSIEKKEYTKAYELLITIRGYKDVDEILRTDENMLKQNKFAIGNQVKLGKYKWSVLAQENGKALLITTDCVEKRPYNVQYEPIIWENCTLRKYLNNEFYNQFNEEEKSQIVKTKVINNDNSRYGTAGGNDTEDNIFLLSIDEANTYFKSNDERIANYDGEAAWWWLRSPGRNGHGAARVHCVGGVRCNGSSVDHDSGAIRPALWINLES